MVSVVMSVRIRSWAKYHSVYPPMSHICRPASLLHLVPAKLNSMLADKHTCTCIYVCVRVRACSGVVLMIMILYRRNKIKIVPLQLFEPKYPTHSLGIVKIYGICELH